MLEIKSDLDVDGNLVATTFIGNGSALVNLTSSPITTVTNSANNRICFGGTPQELKGSADLTYDGTELYFNGNVSGALTGSAESLTNLNTQLVNKDTILNTWTESSFHDKTGIAYSPSLARHVCAGSAIYYSDDNGTNWTVCSGYSGANYVACVYFKGAFIVTGYTYERTYIERSTDGINWTTLYNSTPYTAGAMVVTPTKITVFSQILTRAVSSTDGITWAVEGVSPPIPCIGGITWGNDLYVLSYVSTVYTSPDLVTWTSQTNTLTSACRSACFGNGKYVLMDDDGLHTSSNGTSWTKTYSGSNFVGLVRFIDGHFICWSYGTMLISVDGTTWSSVTSGLSSASRFRDCISTIKGYIFVGQLDGYRLAVNINNNYAEGVMRYVPSLNLLQARNNIQWNTFSVEDANLGGGIYGNSYGFSAGGYTTADTSIIQRFAFGSGANASNVGNLSVGNSYTNGCSTTLNGYTVGGNNGAFRNNIEKFSFGSLGTAIEIGDLAVPQYDKCSAQSNLNGYCSGGGSYSATIERFAFGSNNNATEIGNLPEARTHSAGLSSSTDGYNCGGYNNGTKNSIVKYSFGSSLNVTDVSDLLAGGYAHKGQSTATEGFICGGETTSATNIIQKFTFSTGSNASDHGDLTTTKDWLTTQSSSTDGYCTGGGNPTYLNIIERFSFSVASNAVDHGDLTVSTITAAGLQV